MLALLLHDGALNPDGADMPLAALLIGAEGGLPGEALLAARTGVMRKTALHLAVGGGVCAARDAQRASVLELLLDRPEVDVNARDVAARFVFPPRLLQRTSACARSMRLLPPLSQCKLCLRVA